jgi:hypothetical protein
MERPCAVARGGHQQFWVQVTVSILKPPHGGFRSDMVAAATCYVAVSKAKRETVKNG